MDEERLDEAEVQPVVEDSPAEDTPVESVRPAPEQEDSLPTKKKKRLWLRILLWTLAVILTIAMTVALYFGIRIWRMLNSVNYMTESEYTLSSEQVESIHLEDTENQTMSPEEETDPEMPNLGDLENQFTSEPATVPSDSASEPSQGTSAPGTTEPPATEPTTSVGDILNILLIGQDRRPGESRARSDSMILVTFNKTTHEITLTSFLRDAYVQIPGYKPHKLCHAFQYGGMSLLNQTLEVNFGVNVDGDICVDFSQFEQIIDYLGGVDIKLTKKESDYMKQEYGLNVEPGLQRLNGKEALYYSRIRQIDTDYRRAGRQRTVLMSLVERYKSLSVTEMLDMLEEVLPMISTNIDKNDVIPLAMELFPLLTSCVFKTQQIPAEGTFIGGNVKVRPGLKNWFEYNIDFEENRRILQEIFDAD